MFVIVGFGVGEVSRVGGAGDQEWEYSPLSEWSRGLLV